MVGTARYRAVHVHVNHQTGTYRPVRAVQDSTKNLGIDQGFPYRSVPMYRVYLGMRRRNARGEGIAHGRRIARENQGRATHGETSFSLFFLSLLFFLLNRPPRSKLTVDDRFRRYHPIASNPRTNQLTDQYVPPGTGPYCSVRQSLV
ncbi:hypothetical protein BHM03_00058013 [Ensete ventricosum]|nr:hypothetical protein BHM03_00058013 [Ensete ventricosum]